MLAHSRYASYEAYDDYESEEGDQEEEEQEVEEDPRARKELVDFLKLRENLKEKIRQKYKKENAAALGSNRSLDKKDKPAKDVNFGSFFGPSQRVIAPRVIEESKTIRESERAISRSYPPAPAARRPSSNSEGKPIPSRKPLPSGKPHRVINEVQKKVRTLRETRDYSFLLSDDADLPAPASAPPKAVASPAPPPRSGSGPNPKLPRQQQMPGRQQPRKVESSQRPGLPARPIRPRITPPRSGGGSGSTVRLPATVIKKPISSSSVSAQQRREAHDRPKQRTLPSSSFSKPLNHQRASLRVEREDERRREKPRAVEVKKSGRPRNPFGDDDDDIDDPMSFLRNKLLSKYHSSKYQDDGDDSDMEANFEDIMKEERRSSKIAKQEDEEQLRLIEEEEEREKMRRDAKRRKLQRR